MKHIRYIAVLAVLCMALTAFSGCSGGISSEEARNQVDVFFAHIVSEDYASVQGCLHPGVQEDVQSFLEFLEEQLEVDFQAGMEIRRYTGFQTSWYHSRVGGSLYSLRMDVEVGETVLDITVEIVRNEEGYGISSFKVNKL